MACETMTRPGQSLAARMTEVKVAVKSLETRIQTGSVRLTIAPNGAIAFTGWKAEERAGVSDACAFRSLTAEGSWVLRQAVARAESLQGRKISTVAVAAGVHSHDGGSTWHKGH